MDKNKTEGLRIDGKKLKIAIVLPYFNENLGLELLKNAKKELLKHKVLEKNIKVFRVAGALEIPFACKKIIKKYKPNAIIALGIIIKGETDHYDVVKNSTYKGIMKVQLGNGIPIAFGVLTCQTLKQAEKRASAKGLNKGAEAAKAALIQTTI
jgi:6,7-dimethyl-8-ribityllumazine synthase